MREQDTSHQRQRASPNAPAKRVVLPSTKHVAPTHFSMPTACSTSASVTEAEEKASFGVNDLHATVAEAATACSREIQLKVRVMMKMWHASHARHAAWPCRSQVPAITPFHQHHLSSTEPPLCPFYEHITNHAITKNVHVDPGIHDSTEFVPKPAPETAWQAWPQEPAARRPAQARRDASDGSPL